MSEAPDEGSPRSDDELAARAEEAMRLGLLHDDVVIRRILVASATRLIRGAVLTKEPTAEDSPKDRSSESKASPPPRLVFYS